MSSRLRGARQRLIVSSLAGVACTLVVLVAATPAFSAASPWWRLSSRPAPTYLPPERTEQKIFAYFTNLGDQPTSGAVTLKDTLPPNVEATSARVRSELAEACVSAEATKKLSCTLTEPVLPYERVEYQITVRLLPGAKTGESNTVSVSGGGAAEKTLSRPIRVSSEPVPFGLEKAQLTPEEEGGAPDERAGSHPFQLTTTLDFNQILEEFPLVRPGLHFPAAPALLRDLGVKLPSGLIGNVNAVPQCSARDFSTLISFGPKNNINACPASTAVGTAVFTLSEPANLPGASTTTPVFNLTPAPGEPARLGFVGLKVPVILKTSVQTGADYSVVVSTANTTELASVLSTEVTIWGEPGDAAHDNSRGWVCILGGHFVGHSEPCTPPTERPTVPFLRMPTSCGALGLTVEGRSWPRKEAPEGLPLGQPQPLEGESIFQDNLGGCEGLPFESKINVTADTQAANTPTGLTVGVEVPQKESLQLGGKTAADVKSTTLALPEGVLTSPAAADGLLSCSIGEAGFLGVGPTGADQFTPSPASCEDAAKVATVQIESPFLPPERDRDGNIVLEEGHPVLEKVTGALYLATQNENPFGSLLALYLVGETPVSHVRVKLAGEIKLNEATGQIVSTFRNTPQLPFEHLQVKFFSGPRASVTTPPLCGTYTATSSVESWSGKQEAPSSSFEITSGPGGTACSNPQPFAPTMQAGTTNNQAAAFTPFSLTIGRPDSSQALTSITLRLPTGLAGILKNVPLCPEPQASQGTCSPASLIGHAISSSGLGSDPFTLSGQVYLTGPYSGAPFGVTIVTPANAGPINSNGLPTFHLGNVIVRSGIFVDPYTAAVTIKTAVPTFVETAQVGKPGIPVQLKQTNVTIDRPNFQFNPTNCTPTKIEATLTGAQGGVASLASPFQVANCAALPFKPGFEAEVAGKGSKPNGVTFKVITTSTGLGQAGIAKVFVALPIQLPSRLSTIQKACRDFQFEANPISGCPQDSNIGSATIRTPVFTNPLTGPAYLVSHGNASFPDVEFVLQGEGVLLILDGKTDIKKGITYSRFESTPDAPFTRFETTLPAGPHSALTANVPESKHFNLCGEKLTMPTEIYGQNGVLIKQKTKIRVTGCPKQKKLTRKQLLARALKACKKKHSHKKRVACERAARKKYGAKKAKKGKKKH